MVTSNKIFFTQAWDNGKKLGRYYNEFMNLLPDDAYGCLMDYDTQFLTNDFGKHLYEYIKLYPNATFTCRTNRMHKSNTNQQLTGIERDNHDILYHREIARKRKIHLYEVTKLNDHRRKELMGGMLMLISKKVWREVGGFKEEGILDVDNKFHLSLIQHDKEVLCMEGIYIYHWYRSDGSMEHLIVK